MEVLNIQVLCSVYSNFVLGAVSFRQNASRGFHGVGTLFGAVSNPEKMKMKRIKRMKRLMMSRL